MRHHCIVWSDWATAAKIQLQKGIRFDTSYYFWPPGWAQNRPGHFTGSAMPMRFADTDGSLIDVYNAPSQMTDESGQTYPFTSDALLSAAVGPQGYYGVYTVNAHTDSADNPVATGVLSSALSRNIPVVSSIQMLTWLDGRNSSSFSGLTWSGNVLTFTISAGSGANGLQAMIPTHSAGALLASMTGPAGAVSSSFDTIKGVEYAFFSATPGTYTATYASDSTPPTVLSTTPTNGAPNVAITSTVTATFSEAMAAGTINATTFLLRDSTNALVPATVGYAAATHVATLTPNAALLSSTTYTATLNATITDQTGNPLASSYTWTFTTGAGPSCPCGGFGTGTPTNPSVNDPNAVEVGVKFRVDLDGFISGIRFYKGTTNTGTHVGSLWSSSGQPLGSATFVNETASGWQQVNFPSPVAVTANTVYVASYHTNTGNYAGDNNYFAAAGVDNPPVHLLRDGVSGGNGVYAYGATSTFPANSFLASNYWVDIVFVLNAGGSPLTVTSTTPAPGAVNVSTSGSILATFSNALNPATVSSSNVQVRDAASAQVSASYSVSGATLTITPTSPLTPATVYTATISTAVKDVNGSSLSTAYSWSFTTTSTSVTCSSPPNVIVAENCLPGNPASEWDVSGVGDPSIQGFATDISVNLGGTIGFKVNTSATAYRLDIYRMGYYGGSGARKITTLNVTGSGNQPACLADPASGLIDCGNWSTATSWTVPSTATSGIYFAKAVRTDTGGASHIFFVVRDDGGHSDILFQTSDATWQAYNDFGGNSLYTGGPGVNPSRAYKVSYNRPFRTRVSEAESWVFNAEYPMVRWLEANGYSVNYFSSIDTERSPALLRNHKIWTSSGHDEYWSAGQRASVQAARDAGVHLAFFSGNTMFWKTRWENSIDGSGTPFRTLVCYKETHANAVIDPSDPPTWTGTWRDPRFSPPADGGRPENALVGNIFRMNGGQNSAITVPQAEGALRLWRNTSIAAMTPGQVATLAPGTIGAEFNVDEDNGFRPAGLMGLSSTSITDPNNYLLDYGSTYGAGTAVHKLTLYKATSGAWVFGAGTYQWSWGLDSNHDRSEFGSTTDVRMQQATINLLADMGAQPNTIQGGVVGAGPPTDTFPPVSSITAPTPGATITVGSPFAITGTATDTAGVVGAVEVSTDGGTTWHAATGSATWSYSWTPTAGGPATIKSRAVDDSGNLETPGAGVAVTVGTGGGSGCTVNCTIWAATTVPAVVDEGPDSPVELGVKFRSDIDGIITGIRFYKAATNTGVHIGNLWSASGQLLGSATFSGESASGWQQVNLTTPLAITANTVYVASYHMNTGHYSQDLNYFASKGADQAPLHALQNGISGFNGVYAYGTGNTFPTLGFNSSNYWVDVVFSAGTAPALTSIAVTPVNPTITLGTTSQFTATGTYADSTTRDITAQVTWSSSSTATATITSAGLASGVAAGTTAISAKQGTITGSTTLTVQAPLTITTTSLPNGQTGSAYSASLAASGGVAPYTWSITTGSLPAGVNLNASTGALTGTPTAGGSFALTFQVRDSATTAATATKSLTLLVITNTGFKSPSSNAPVVLGAGDGNGFQTTPTSAYSSNGAFAVDSNSGTSTSTSCTNAGKDKHDFYTYGITLPAGSTVRGIEVRLDARAGSTTGSPRMCVQLSWNGGVSWTSALTTTTLGTATNTYVLGGAANTWGRSWTLSNLSNTSFRVRVIDVAASTSQSFSLDWIAVRVTY
jgi:hypothetical protein